MAAILDFRSCDIWEHFYVHRWIDHTPKHGIRHQHHLSRLNNTKVMRVFNFGYFGWRPYWIWPKKVPSRFFPPGILIDLVNRPPKENNYVGFKTIPIFSRSNSIFMRLIRMLCDYMIWSAKHWRDVSGCCSAYSLASASHYSDVIMGAMASQITSLTIVYSSIYSGADQRKHQSSASVAFVRGIHRWPVNSLHKRPVTRKIFPFYDVIMSYICKISKQQ